MNEIKYKNYINNNFIQTIRILLKNSIHFGSFSILLIISATVSGIITGLAFTHILWYLGLMGFIPVFYYFVKYKPKPRQTISSALVFSFFQSIFIYSWTFTVIANYTGGSILYGLLAWLMLFLFTCLKYLLLFSLTAWYLKPEPARSLPAWVTIVFAATLFVLTDVAIQMLMRGFPWAFTFMGYTLSSNLYTAQMAEFGGVGALTFIVITFNFLITYFLVLKKWVFFKTAIALVLIIHLWGWLRVGTFENNGEEQIKLALICDNSPADLRWNEKRLNEYVHGLLELNSRALATKPDIIVWNESVIPWTFEENDDFFQAIMEQSKGYGVHHLVSYFTSDEANPGYSSVSAYLINEEAKVAGRYDKSELLAGIEKPLFSFFGGSSLQLPFFNQNSISDNIENKDPMPVDSRFGKIGVMICNESLNYNTMNKLTRQGADYLILISNDNWFDQTALIKQHFYFSRMRAIEHRKPIAINANLGISGLIDRSGRVVESSFTRSPEIINLILYKSTYKGNFNLIQSIFQSLLILSIFLTILKRRYK